MPALYNDRDGTTRLCAAYGWKQDNRNPLAKKKKHRSNREWLDRHVNDSFVKKARKEGFRARSAFKLEEIDRKDRLVRAGMNIIDLGAAPGGWCQYVSRRLSGNGHLVAVDLLAMEDVPGTEFIQGDFTAPEIQQQISSIIDGGKFDLVLSDMAPNLTGIPVADQARSIGLAEEVLYWCQANMAKDGSLLIKVFQGSGFDELRSEMRKSFRSIATRKPDASRASSSELYLLAKGFSATTQ
jgi:23S rRNA (uridine2552-2'-O)-methyltransferase